MTKEQSFLTILGKKNKSVLSLPNETIVKIKVGAISQLVAEFHAKGYDDGRGDLSYFDKLFGK